MKPEEMIEGMRVRIVREVEIYPLGVFEVGLLGVVKEVYTPDPRGHWTQEIVCSVLLDEPRQELLSWDNCLQVYIPEDCGGAIAEDFEPAVGFV